MAQLNPTQNAWFWLILLVIFSTVIPSFMMAEAISRIGSVRTSLVGMLGPVFTIALAVYWLDEPLTILIIVGVILMIGGVMSLMRRA
jgi:drug/metabolite transporter (DMT)-like permease